MVGRAAGDDDDAADIADLLGRHGQILQYHPSPLQSGGGSLPNGAGLLKDLLEHKVGIAPLFGSVDLPIHMMMLLGHLIAEGIIHGDAIRRQHGHLSVLHISDIPGMADDRSDIGGDEALPLAEAQQKRRVLAHGNEPVRCVGGHDAQSVGTLHGVDHPPDGLHHVSTLFIVVVQKLHHHLGVGLGTKLIALVQELAFQLRKVLDNTVVHHRNVAAAAHMGMGIDVVGFAVGGPAGVTDAQAAGQVRPLVGQILQHLQAALGLLHPHPAFTAYGDTGGVIAAVFQPLQSVQQNGGGLLPAHITYDSTHIFSS